MDIGHRQWLDKLRSIDDIDPELLVAVEDVLFDRREDATERLVDLAESVVKTDSGRRARTWLLGECNQSKSG